MKKTAEEEEEEAPALPEDSMTSCPLEAGLLGIPADGVCWWEELGLFDTPTAWERPPEV